MVDNPQKPKAIPLRFGATKDKHEWLVASPLVDAFVPTIRDEQKETLYHIRNFGVWTDEMYHKPVGEVTKRLVLSGLRPYCAEAMAGVIEEFYRLKARGADYFNKDNSGDHSNANSAG